MCWILGVSCRLSLKEGDPERGAQERDASFCFVGSFVHQIPLLIRVLPAFVSQEGAEYFAWPPVLSTLGTWQDHSIPLHFPLFLFLLIPLLWRGYHGSGKKIGILVGGGHLSGPFFTRFGVLQ